MSNSLDPDQAWPFVGPDLGPNCLQRLSADNKSPLVEKELKHQVGFLIFFFFFSEKISLNISCKSSASQIIHMKYQDILHEKEKKKISAAVVIGA